MFIRTCIYLIDIVDAGDTVGQDFDRSDISIHEAQPALLRTARVSKVPQRFDDFILVCLTSKTLLSI
jgi:hypothetical protein